jgi:hypothetical protein
MNDFNPLKNNIANSINQQFKVQRIRSAIVNNQAEIAGSKVNPETEKPDSFNTNPENFKSADTPIQEWGKIVFPQPDGENTGITPVIVVDDKPNMPASSELDLGNVKLPESPSIDSNVFENFSGSNKATFDNTKPVASNGQTVDVMPKIYVDDKGNRIYGD